MRSYFCTSVHVTWTEFLLSFSLTLRLTIAEIPILPASDELYGFHRQMTTARSNPEEREYTNYFARFLAIQ